MHDEPRQSEATLIGCPGCAGVLSTASRAEGFAEYRCQVGHAYDLSDLLAAKERQLEHALWSAMVLLEHVETIIGTALDRANATPVPAGRASLERRREQARAQVVLLESVVAADHGPDPMAVAPGTKRDIVVIGASLGGVKALRRVFGGLPGDFQGSVAAVIHRGPFHTGGLGALFGREAQLPVLEPEEPVHVKPGTLYLAPRDRHLIFRDHRLEPDRGAREHFTRPAIDPLFRSAAAIYGSRVVGVILTGGGRDGVSGLVAIKSRGGVSLVQDPEEAEAPVMPESAIEYDHVDLVLPLDCISAVLVQLAAGEAVQPGGLNRPPIRSR